MNSMWARENGACVSRNFTIAFVQNIYFCRIYTIYSHYSQTWMNCFSSWLCLASHKLCLFTIAAYTSGCPKLSWILLCCSVQKMYKWHLSCFSGGYAAWTFKHCVLEYFHVAHVQRYRDIVASRLPNYLRSIRKRETQKRTQKLLSTSILWRVGG